MTLIEIPKQHVVFRLARDDFKPFTSIRGPLSFETITAENVHDVSVRFPSGKMEVFHQKLQRGDLGIFVRHRADVVGYMWSKEYDTRKLINVDQYIPLKGRFSHIHFARVAHDMKGRGIQLLMLTYLIHDAYNKGIDDIYTDCEQDNVVSIRGIMKVGFQEIFRLLVIELAGRKIPIKYLGYNDPYNGKDPIGKIALGKAKLVYSDLRNNLQRAYLV